MRNPSYCDEDVTFPAQPSWMSGLSDDLELRRMSIPGTHQTCARRAGAAFVCQGLSLADQLRAGIRYLDIRCRHFKAGFSIHHDVHYQGYWFDKKFQFEDHANPCVLDDCIEFLKRNPRECIIMSVKAEPPSTDDENDARANDGEWFSDCFCKSIEHSQDFWLDPTTLKSRPPRLGDVRGKIILIRGFADNFAPTWPDAVKNRARGFQKGSSMLGDQDEYEVWEWSVGTKFNLIAKTSDLSRGLKAWYVNHTSGSKGLVPSEIAKRINPRVMGYVAQCGQASGNDGIGMLAMDFPGEGLIGSIIALNHRGKPAERKTLWLADEFGGISHPGGDDNRVNIPAGRSLGGLQVKYQGGYGIINMRFFDSAGNVLMPVRPKSDGRFGNGWVSADFDGDAPGGVNGPIDGIQLAKHERWGIVNLRVHLKGRPAEAWEAWLTPGETDANAECVSEPRVLESTESFRWIETWRQDDHGMVDGRFAYV